LDKHRFGLYVRLVLAAGCVVMGILSFAGAFSNDVGNRRLIFGVGWTLIGAGWLFRCYIGWRKQSGERGAGDET